MKYLKSYENIKKKYPKVGDYVVLKSGYNVGSTLWIEVDYWLRNNIGQIISISKKNNIVVKYNNIPEELLEHFEYPDIKQVRKQKIDDIIYYNSNKEELECIINQNKYNL